MVPLNGSEHSHITHKKDCRGTTMGRHTNVGISDQKLLNFQYPSQNSD